MHKHACLRSSLLSSQNASLLSSLRHLQERKQLISLPMMWWLFNDRVVVCSCRSVRRLISAHC